VGRPAIKLDATKLASAAKTGATQQEIAYHLGISLVTLTRRLEEPKYRKIYEAARGELCIGLRASQIKCAMGIDHQGKQSLPPNPTMLKWLGEQYLDQASNHRMVDKDGKDRPIVDVSPIELINARIAGVLERKRESGGSEGS
jgi:hypothetical protein